MTFLKSQRTEIQRPILDLNSPPPRPPVELQPHISPREVDIVKRGEAIASVRALEDHVSTVEKEAEALRRQLDRCADKCSFLTEELQYWRSAAESYRNMLAELSSDMRNISLLVERAHDTHARIEATITTGKDRSASTAAVELRARSDDAIAAAEEAIVGALQATSSDDTRGGALPSDQDRSS